MPTPDSVSVAPGPLGLDELPPVDEREIVEVDFERVDDRRISSAVHHQACQQCGDAVDLFEPHTWACVWVEDSISRIMHQPVFCDKECWLAWLSRD